ncbi:MAG: TIGR02281 family clan AA aspartic protease [Hyphomonadaceae bacterium]
MRTDISARIFTFSALAGGIALGVLLMTPNEAARQDAVATETAAHAAGTDEAVPALSAFIPRPEPLPPGSARLRKEDDGHYWANVRINGADLRLMVDTGATYVALTRRDAERAGLDILALPENVQVTTANGEVPARSAMLKSVAVDDIDVSGVRAIVIDDGLSQSLLGMSFLNRLKAGA